MTLNEFGRHIKDTRTQLNLSQLELSLKMKLSREQLSKIENGKSNITIETLEKLSTALNLKIHELLSKFESKATQPFVKWAGGKKQLLELLIKSMPKKYDTYFEPFVGGGALFFATKPKKAVINDFNKELIYTYECFQNWDDFNKFIIGCNQKEAKHNEDFYLEVRNLDRQKSFWNKSKAEIASRFVYLNKTCFNGLYRVNSKGFFNVPSNKKKQIKLFDMQNLNNIFNYFNKNSIKVLNVDFQESLKSAKHGDFVYLEPPYDSFDDKIVFNSYTKDSFGKDEQVRLANEFRRLDKLGVKVMASNHNTKHINELYKGFNIKIVEAKRNINSKGSGRGNVEEVIITNYED